MSWFANHSYRRIHWDTLLPIRLRPSSLGGRWGGVRFASCDRSSLGVRLGPASGIIDLLFVLPAIHTSLHWFSATRRTILRFAGRFWSSWTVLSTCFGNLGTIERLRLRTCCRGMGRSTHLNAPWTPWRWIWGCVIAAWVLPRIDTRHHSVGYGRRGCWAWLPKASSPAIWNAPDWP